MMSFSIVDDVTKQLYEDFLGSCIWRRLIGHGIN